MCGCDPCRLVAAYLKRPSMTNIPTEADRLTHLRHVIRDNPPPPPSEKP